MKKPAIAAVIAAVALVPTAAAGGSALTPHVYGVRISGAPVAAFNATWLLGLKQTSFQLARNDAIVVKGTLKIRGSRITFHDVSGVLRCKGTQVNGTYGWHLSGDKLTLTKISDDCPGRGTILSVPYTLVR